MRKTATESVTSSTTLQDDDHLVFAVGVNEVWEFEGFIRVTSSDAAPDIKYTIAAPAGSAILWVSSTQDVLDTPITSNLPVTASGSVVTLDMTAGQTVIIRIRGYVMTDATSGSIKFQWAQNVSDATATQVLVNSFFKAGKF